VANNKSEIQTKESKVRSDKKIEKFSMHCNNFTTGNNVEDFRELRGQKLKYRKFSTIS